MNLLPGDGNAAGSRSGGARTPLPGLPGPVAAAAAGLLCATLAMALVWLGGRGCDAVRGAPSCGGAADVLLLGAVAAVTLLAGFRLLQLLRVPDAGLTNLLGFSLFVIVLMTRLLEDAVSAYRWAVPPGLAALTYAAAAWVADALARLSDRG